MIGIVIPTLESRHRYKCTALELSHLNHNCKYTRPRAISRGSSSRRPPAPPCSLPCRPHPLFCPSSSSDNYVVLPGYPHLRYRLAYRSVPLSETTGANTLLCRASFFVSFVLSHSLALSCCLSHRPLPRRKCCPFALSSFFARRLGSVFPISFNLLGKHARELISFS